MAKQQFSSEVHSHKGCVAISGWKLGAENSTQASSTGGKDQLFRMLLLLPKAVRYQEAGMETGVGLEPGFKQASHVALTTRPNDHPQIPLGAKCLCSGYLATHCKIKVL